MTLSERIAQTAIARAERRAECSHRMTCLHSQCRESRAVTSPWVARAIARTLPPKELTR